MNKKYIVVTGGAGFVGTNLIELLIKKTNHKIISIDNYSSGKKKIISKVKELNIIMLILKIFLKFSKNLMM